MIQFRLKKGEGLLIGPDCIRVFIAHVEQLEGGEFVMDVGVHAPPKVAVNRDAIPRAAHLDKQKAIERRGGVQDQR